METPYFVIHQAELDNAVASLKNAISDFWPNCRVGYSVKTNSIPWLLRYMRAQGFYAEVVSDDEYEMAKLCGYTSSSIIYNGIAKTRSTFLDAIECGALVHLDSWRELQWLKELTPGRGYEVGLRVNFDLESMCPGETACGAEGGRFGFCYENGELERAMNVLKSIPNVSLASLHLHCSTKTRSLNIYRAIGETACKIAEIYQLKLKYVDVGGGFFGGMPDKPQFSDYLSAIRESLSAYFQPDETTLIIEPGISLIGSPVSYVTTVVDVKETTYNRFIISDGSRIHIDPLMHKSNYLYTIDRKSTPDTDMVKKQVICGYTCMETDRIMEVQNVPPLQCGDQICYQKAGAYTMNLASQFIRFFPAVYLERENTLDEIQRKWSVEDVAREQLSRI